MIRPWNWYPPEAMIQAEMKATGCDYMQAIYRLRGRAALQNVGR